MELNLNVAKGIATEYAKKFNKQIVGAKEFNSNFSQTAVNIDN